MAEIADAKARLRHHIIAARRSVDPEQRSADAEALARRVLELPELSRPTTVAAYVSYRTEPGTGPLLAALKQRGHRVLMPVLRPDRDLEWEDAGRHVGVAAIGQASVVICPGLAADTTGVRLGRGGGSYDRALARCQATTLRVLLLHDTELVESVPADPHDQAVDVVVTPIRTLRLR